MRTTFQKTQSCNIFIKLDQAVYVVCLVDMCLKTENGGVFLSWLKGTQRWELLAGTGEWPLVWANFYQCTYSWYLRQWGIWQHSWCSPTGMSSCALVDCFVPVITIPWNMSSQSYSQIHLQSLFLNLTSIFFRLWMASRFVILRKSSLSFHKRSSHMKLYDISQMSGIP